MNTEYQTGSTKNLVLSLYITKETQKTSNSVRSPLIMTTKVFEGDIGAKTSFMYRRLHMSPKVVCTINRRIEDHLYTLRQIKDTTNQMVADGTNIMDS